MKSINYRLYLFELILAFLVVFPHSHAATNYFLDALGRVTVLFFFIMSSYFYNRVLSKENYSYKKDTLKRCLRLLIIYLITLLIYEAIFIPINIYNKGTPQLFDEFNFDNLVEFFKNYPANTGFLWFILALSICYLVYPFIHKISWIHKSKYMIIIPLVILISVYIFRIFAGKYDLGLLSKIESTRNFFFTGLPCFLIGTYIYDHQDDFKKISSLSFYIFLVISIGLMMLEAYIHYLIGTRVNEFYLGSICIAIITMIYSIQNPDSKVGDKLYYYLGSRCPTLVYLSHILFLNLYYFLFIFDYSDILVIPLAVLSPILIAFVITYFKGKTYNKYS